MEALASRFSPHNVVGCALKVATVLQDDGRIAQLSSLQDLAYGELDGRTTPRIEALHAFMQGAKIGARLSSDIHREMWEKWVLLAAGGAITCLMRGTVGEVEACAGGAAFALQLLDEVVAVVRKVGKPPSDAMLASARQTLTATGSSFATSMYRDLQRGHAVEVENIIGDLVRHGEVAGIATPLLSAACVHLRVFQNRVAWALS
jgi:2-dehydropantoate 2-reductase